MLNRSSATRPLLEYHITWGYRITQTCRDTIVRAITSNAWDVLMAPKPKEPQNDPTTRACKRSKCKYSAMIDTGGR